MQKFSINNLVPDALGTMTFKKSSIRYFLGVMLFGSVALVCIGSGYQGGIHSNQVDIPSGILYWIGGTFVCIALFAYRFLKASLRPSNWLLKLCNGFFTIKYRSFLNDHFSGDDVVIVRLNSSEIDWARSCKESLYTLNNRGGRTLHRVNHLELKLINPELSGQIKTLLDQERRREAPLINGWRVKNGDYPVALFKDDILRLQWSGMNQSLSQALTAASKSITIEEPVEVETDLTSRDSNKEVEDELLQLIERGMTIDATRLARRHYGYTTTEARRFVSELNG